MILTQQTPYQMSQPARLGLAVLACVVLPLSAQFLQAKDQEQGILTAVIEQREGPPKPVLLPRSTEKRASYNVTGEIKHQDFYKDGDLNRSQRMSFHLKVRDTKWEAHIYPIVNCLYDKKSVFFDGNRLYFYTLLESSIERARALGKDVSQDTNLGTALVVEHEVPHWSFYHSMGPVWIALASADYLGKLQQDYAEPPGALRTFGGFLLDPEVSFVQKIERQMSGRAPFLPEHVLYLSDNRRKEHLGDGIVKIENIPPDELKFFPGSEYRCEEFATVDGLHFPKRAWYRIYFYNEFNIAALHKKISHNYEILIHKATKATGRLKGNLVFPSRTAVLDKRFLKDKEPAGTISYTSNRFLQDGEIKETDAYERAKQSYAKRKEHARKRRFVNGALLLQK